jgi:hypothetical protein
MLNIPFRVLASLWAIFPGIIYILYLAFTYSPPGLDYGFTKVLLLSSAITVLFVILIAIKSNPYVLKLRWRFEIFSSFDIFILTCAVNAVFVFAILLKADIVFKLVTLALPFDGHLSRDMLYAIRESLMDGKIEIGFMLLLGSILVCIPSRSRLLMSITIISLINVFSMAAIELLTASRFFSMSLAMTFLVASYVLIDLRCKAYYSPQQNSSQSILMPRRQLSEKLLLLYICFLIVASAVPTATRFLVYKHLPSPSADAREMKAQISKFEDQSRKINGQIQVSGLRPRLNDNLSQPKHALNLETGKVLNDFACQVIAGPALDTRFCSGYNRNYLLAKYQSFYEGYWGPVLPTALYWRFGNPAFKLAIVLNWVVLIGFFAVGAFSLASGISRISKIFLYLYPLWSIKMLSFFRGDPIHAGINLLWVASLLLLLAYISFQLRIKTS